MAMIKSLGDIVFSVLRTITTPKISDIWNRFDKLQQKNVEKKKQVCLEKSERDL